MSKNIAPTHPIKTSGPTSDGTAREATLAAAEQHRTAVANDKATAKEADANEKRIDKELGSPVVAKNHPMNLESEQSKK